MPGEMLYRPDPQPLPSRMPEYVDNLLVKLDKPNLSPEINSALQKYWRTANYIVAAMIFLQDNVYLTPDLKFEDIKPRLLGQWGTCPALMLIYSHLNHLVKIHGLDVIYVVGSGQGAPIILANL
jgi:xylulose-5-phosphate/fructose-6-phosphate phosphoketolase